MMLPLLFQNPMPDTIPYMLLGYAIIGGVGLVYTVSLVLRQRGLRRDLELIERLNLDEDD